MPPARSIKSALFLLLFLLLLAIPKPIYASTDQFYPTQSNIGSPQYTNYLLINIFHGISCELAGASPLANQPCLTYENGIPVLRDKLQNGGLLGTVSNLVATMYAEPPTSSSLYLADLGNQLGIVSPAYAQSVGGSGEGVIRPVMRLWQVSRNIAYLVFILIFIAVGFMIMFRQKINPQTVVTIQAALPGLIVGLILVTFSYFITALIVDLAFLLLPFLIMLFEQAGPNQFLNSVDSQYSALQLTNPNGLNMIEFTKNFLLNGDHFKNVIRIVSNAIQFNIGADFLGINSKTVILGGVVQGFAWFVGFLATIIILLGVIIQMVRLFMALVIAYITILVSTITAPFIILFSALPGQGGKIDMWWRTILGNILIFPAIFVAFLFAGAILANTTGFKQTLPFFAGFPANLLPVIIAYGIILGTPAIPQMVKSALKVPDIKGIPQAGVQGFQAGFGGLTSTVGAGYNLAGSRLGLKAWQDARAKYVQDQIYTPGGANPAVAGRRAGLLGLLPKVKG